MDRKYYALERLRGSEKEADWVEELKTLKPWFPRSE